MGKILRINAKCDDRCQTRVYISESPYQSKSPTIIEKNGYVPYISCLGGGDYIKLDIDIETGKILNWNKDGVIAWIEERELDDNY